MTNLLLPLIYLAFISLGLTDALLGSAWPAVYSDFQVPVSYAGIVSIVIALGTVTSSLLSDRIIAWVQLAITAVLFLSLPLRKHHEGIEVTTNSEGSPGSNAPARPQSLKLSQVVRIRGVKEMMTCFFCYSVLEQTAALWAGTYLRLFKGMDAAAAAAFAGMLFLGVTLGRAVSGILAIRLSDQQLIRLGMLLAAAGVAILIIPGSTGLAICGLMAIGLGCSPIYPAMLHATPQIFGKDRSRAATGVQMASFYLAIFIMPPLFGLIAQYLSVGLLPVYLTLPLGVFALMQRRLASIGY